MCRLLTQKLTWMRNINRWKWSWEKTGRRLGSWSRLMTRTALSGWTRTSNWKYCSWGIWVQSPHRWKAKRKMMIISWKFLKVTLMYLYGWFYYSYELEFFFGFKYPDVHICFFFWKYFSIFDFKHFNIQMFSLKIQLFCSLKVCKYSSL